jgi:asparagine synthase (glutamine-hydrolysing)
MQGLDVLSDVIYHLETFDVTTIRASTPMFLLARRIKVFLDLVFLIRI